MANNAPRNDLGIIFYATGAGSATYVDRFGQTRTALTLSSSYQGMAAAIETAIIHAGLKQALTLEVTIGKSGASSFDVKLVGRHGVDLAADSPTPLWGLVQTVLEDTGISAAEHNFTSARRYILQTASGMSLGQCRIEAKATTMTSLASGDFVIVQAMIA